MMDGRTKCKILKGIRQRIADINGIPYSPHPCNNAGDCVVTCPMCDHELVWLDMQLKAKLAEGYRVYTTRCDFEDYVESLKIREAFQICR